MSPSFTTVGRSIPRIDIRSRVTGSVDYVINMELPGMLHVALLRSPVPHARIVRIDASRAEAAPGVVAVLTREDLRGNDIDPYYGPVVRDQAIVAIDKVRYVGDIVAAIAAVDKRSAQKALDLIDVEYEELPAVFDAVQAVADDAPLIHETLRPAGVGFADIRALNLGGRGNVCSHFKLRRGDVEAGFADSDFIFEDEFFVPAVQHAHLEPHATVAMVHADGLIDVWSSTQNPSVIREQLAEVFRVGISKVRVRALSVGGGYGSKTYPKLEPLAVALARKAGRPVKIVLSREEVFLTCTRHAVTTRIKTGVKRDGTLVARKCELYFDTGAYADIGPRTSKNGGYASGGPYRIPHVWVDSYCVYTNKPPAGAFRGFGVSQVAWAYEQQMDMIAERLGIDPVELRLKNLVDEGDAFATGEVLHAVPLKKALQRVAEALEWDGGKPVRVSEHRVRAKGVACILKSTMTPSVSTATVKMEEDGTISVLTGTVEIGQGSGTVLAQIAAETLGIPVEYVHVVHSDTAVTPYDQSTSSSRSTFSMGTAVRRAALEVREQILQIAGEQLEIHPDDLVIEDGHVFPRAYPERRLSLREVIRRRFGMGVGSIMGRGTFASEGHLDPDTGQGKASAFWFSGAGGCEVEVDLGTGSVKVLKFVMACNAGKAINPHLVEGQMEGSLLTGLGSTFTEQMIFDGGQLVNPNFTDYPLPSIADTPLEVRSIILEEPHRDGPFGAIGIGETAIPTVAPAIGNAVYNATGVRIFSLPITPEKILRGLRGLPLEGEVAVR